MGTALTGRRVAVVTGGTRGIGLGLARELLERGHQVAICGRSAGSVDAGVQQLRAGLDDPGRVLGVVTDVSDRDAVQALWQQAVATFGRVDIWINNAGMSAPRGPLADQPSELVDAVVQTNLVGAFNGSAIAQAGMATQAGGGWIWNMEGFGSRGEHQPGMATYGASKRAVQYLTEALVRDTKGTPVKVGFLSPGIVATDLLIGDYADKPEEFEKVKKIFNILGDRVETVTPWLVDQVLAASKHGVRVAWLTKPKAMGRFMGAGFRKRDIFTPQEA
ncbi:SDR family NAD(P)-dependent oxidoreductase [Aeromicrobium wangtongii]|uniref:SDR family NAD(P)-dependent oxidoreductase n=1 Tax=Aeromicrobium wangtongii TaxID=2969247 RepID=UPI0020173124|nr:SDR family oxidoreductase [Aeromicrobium wangtongii]MCL3818700.1 SDR family oxidoreductase [Aeromicrobium wangtongii]